MVDVSTVVAILSASSSAAVVMSAVFVLIQLRQNAALLQATLTQSRASFSLSVLERITNETFPRRRARMFEILQRFRANDWAGAFETPDDFEIRNFAYFYELLGQMARNNLVDAEILLDSLQYIVVRDWQVFEPHARFIEREYHLDPGASYSNFHWMAEEARWHLAHRTEERRSGVTDRSIHARAPGARPFPAGLDEDHASHSTGASVPVNRPPPSER